MLVLRVGLPRRHSGKESACQCKRRGFNPGVGKIPWRKKWQPTPVFLPLPRTEKPGGLQSMGLQRVGHKWALTAYAVLWVPHGRVGWLCPWSHFVPLVWTRGCIFQASALIVVPNSNRNKNLGPCGLAQFLHSPHKLLPPSLPPL